MLRKIYLFEQVYLLDNKTLTFHVKDDNICYIEKMTLIFPTAPNPDAPNEPLLLRLRPHHPKGSHFTNRSFSLLERGVAENGEHFLGKGTYGQVSIRDGKAVKNYARLSYLIQEYMALQYLADCRYIVHTEGVDFLRLELHMQLYDCSLRIWLEEHDGHMASRRDMMKIFHDVLCGLVELHDRKLAHGDLKPGNILIKRSPLRAVLGDCGFVSIDKYAKVERTARAYRDPVIGHDATHDMFSFGICFLEMVGHLRFLRQADYNELKDTVDKYIDDTDYRDMLHGLLNPDREKRPTARETLERLFNESPARWVQLEITLASFSGGHSERSSVFSIPREDRQYVRELMKKTADSYEINRAKKGFGALLALLDNNKIEASLYCIYTAVTLMILSSVFGKSGFREAEVLTLSGNKYTMSFVYKILREITSDPVFLRFLLTPSS